MSSLSVLSQRSLSTYLVQYARSLAPGLILVGDGYAPDEGGWNGPLGRSTFVPYAVIGITGMRPQTSTLCDVAGDLNVSVRMSSHGVSREQAEVVADGMRGKMDTLIGQKLDVGPMKWSVQQLKDPSFGGANRDSSIDPAYWAVTDSFGMVMSLTSTPGTVTLGPHAVAKTTAATKREV